MTSSTLSWFIGRVCVLLAFLTFTLFLIFLSQYPAFELYLCGGVGS